MELQQWFSSLVNKLCEGLENCGIMRSLVAMLASKVRARSLGILPYALYDTHSVLYELLRVSSSRWRFWSSPKGTPLPSPSSPSNSLCFTSSEFSLQALLFDIFLQKPNSSLAALIFFENFLTGAPRRELLIAIQTLFWILFVFLLEPRK